MRFDHSLRYAADRAAVQRALTDPDFYASLDGLEKVERPDVLSHRSDGHTAELSVRYRFVGDLSGAVRAAVDPARLSWVEHSSHDFTAGTIDSRLEPDHYPDRLACSATTTISAAGDGTVRRIVGTLSVKVRLVGRMVEGAIVSGLVDHFEEEAPYLESWASARR